MSSSSRTWISVPSHSDPHHTDHDIHPLALTTLILVAPHAVLLVVPECSACRVHPSPSHLLVPAQAIAAYPSWVAKVLDDGGVYDEFVLGRGGFGLGDERLEDVVDDGVVPRLRSGVLVDGGGAYGGIACVVADLAEAGRGDWLWRRRVSRWRL